MPGLPRGAELNRPWVEPDRDHSGDEHAIRFGTRATVEERPEFQLPVGGQEFLDVVTRLPSDPVVRSEAIRLIMQMQRIWLPMVKEHMLSVDEEWRLEVLRAWAQVTALIQASWTSLAMQLAKARPLANRIDALRGLASALISIAPQRFDEAMRVIEDTPTELWVDRLMEFARGHPKWMTPPTVEYASYTKLSVDPAQGASHWVAPPPAPQSVCIVTDFDPAWGTPPRWYRGAPVRLDPTLGAYEYDYDDRGRYIFDATGKRVQIDGMPGDPNEIATIRSTFEQGRAVLQPFKRPGSDTWEYRWIARDRSARCNPL